MIKLWFRIRSEIFGEVQYPWKKGTAGFLVQNLKNSTECKRKIIYKQFQVLTWLNKINN